MKNTKVISFKSLPNRFPVLFTAVVYLFMDKFNAGGLAWGIVGTLLAIIWAYSLYAIINQEQIDILDNK